MYFPERTPLGQVVIYNRETGQAIERWPVDAIPMVSCGEFSQFPPTAETERFNLDPDAPPYLPDHVHQPNKFESTEEIDGLETKITRTICSVCEEELEPPVMEKLEHSPGVPIVITKSSEAGPAQPVKLPGA